MKDLKSWFGHKTVQIICLGVAALILLILVWQVFFAKEERKLQGGETEREIRMSEILGKLNGIDQAYVLITEDDGVAVGAIVFFEGEDSILSRIQIVDVTSSALNIEKKNIQVYPV